ncbi:hypothetical protein HDU97_010344 [Phlyctochytrium planicorne]|nr:hypothetical protein HDU97_010344 [Phlyctochytrium planicorne]
MSYPLCPSLPPEVITAILIWTRDIKLCLKLEAIAADLSNRFPDAGIALDAINVHNTFCASTFLSTQAAKGTLDIGILDTTTLLQVAFEHKIFASKTRESLRRNIDSIRIIQYVNSRPEPDVYFCKESSSEPEPTPLDCAVIGGYLDSVKYLFEIQRTECFSNIMDFAALEGHLSIVKFLHAHPEQGLCTQMAMDEAASAGHLEIVKFLHFNRNEGCTTLAMDDAAESGHLHIVSFLHFNRTEGCTAKAIDSAARNGHLDVIKFLHANRTEGCTAKAGQDAIGNGHLDVVEFLYENLIEKFPPSAMTIAAMRNRVQIGRFLLQSGHQGEDEDNINMAMHYALMLGHLEFVVFLNEEVKEFCLHNVAYAAACHRDVATYINEKSVRIVKPAKDEIL